jgi:hypothetical protein
MLVDVCFYEEPMVWGSKKYIISVLVLAPVLIPVSQINKIGNPIVSLVFKIIQFQFWFQKIKPDFNLVFANQNQNW